MSQTKEIVLFTKKEVIEAKNKLNIIFSLFDPCKHYFDAANDGYRYAANRQIEKFFTMAESAYTTLLLLPFTEKQMSTVKQFEPLFADVRELINAAGFAVKKHKASLLLTKKEYYKSIIDTIVKDL